MKTMTREELSWILYDVGNSAFVLVMVTAIMPLYFKEIAANTISDSASFALWGYANSGASLCIALLAPVLGTLSDFKGMKKKFFTFFLFLGIGVTLLLIIPPPGRYLFTLFLFVLARVAWSGSLVFYDSFITDITSKKRIDMISAHGYGWGYIGSVIPFIFVLILVYLLSVPGTISITQVSGKISFGIVALWWLLFSIPMLKHVSQKNYIDRPPSATIIKGSFLQIIKTVKHISSYRNILLFLGAYFFYIDGVHTIISMAIAYGHDIGLDTLTMIGAVLMIQVLAFPFALLYGKSASKFSAKRMIHIGIIIYIAITLIAYIMSGLENRAVQTLLFWFIAFLVATSMGGVQALSRSLFGRIIPEESSGEFFGFYNVFGKFAAIMGPLIMGTISQISGKSQYGIVGIVPLFVIGSILLLKVRESEDLAQQKE